MSRDPSWRLLGQPRKGGITIISDHASNRVPDGVDLGIPARHLDEHIAIDIGVAAVADLMVAQGGADTAWLGHVSRLVCDLNRDEFSPGVIPETSDLVPIPGNVLDAAGRAARLARYHRPYHEALEAMLAANEPALILSLHSFTPSLSEHPQEQRPWHIGVLYNRDARAPHIALPWLRDQPGLCVGDQQPYSGHVLNYSMDRHGEGHGRLYLGVELRQDLISGPAGQAEWAARLSALCAHVASASGA
ncbi:MAG: N-formylglutamate amidohydrolase [Sphingomonadales bacterium]|nr:N-formylglutamate amidohydrolase [Sphingomonadales bacterium]MDE2169518.1 N-formylglutamate amidohydrolase [Sphingomonadales bacterium]